jgi:hypothetical protein
MAKDFYHTGLAVGRSDCAKILDLTTTNAELEQISGVILSDMTEGAGITAGTLTICQHSVTKVGGLYNTNIRVDLTGLDSSGTADDIIGDVAGGAAHIGQITAAKNGTIVYSTITVLETPATGDTDINISTSTAASGAFDADVTALAGYAQLLNGGTWSAAAATQILLTAIPAANSYIYLSQGGTTNNEYSAGIFMLELWGV